MAEHNGDVDQALGKIARAMVDMDDAPVALVELAEMASAEDADHEAVKKAAELMLPSDRLAALLFCVALRDSYATAGDPALAEGLELMKALLAPADHEDDT